ncbi:RES family NAD+ phosphorylase [Georgenia sp. MJ173]|uniref:RES family NAD+ phosphorylase n=1 Tax=Georgenia sunbinii TaxID=3117728 RepID=UPI002F265F28
MTARRRATSFLPPPIDLHGYPSRELATGEVVYRSHHKDYGPVYFSSASADPDEGGRFDLPAPGGTCYAATDALVALRERFGPELMDHGEVPASAVSEARVSRLRLQKGVTLADTAAELSANFHPLELATSPDYALTQRWASGCHAHGFDGVIYQARFTTRDTAAALALFGDAGPGDWPADEKMDVTALIRAAGLKVATRRPARNHFSKATTPTA